jgi:hypothetical protein
LTGLSSRTRFSELLNQWFRMARYNEILVGRYNRLAQKLFSMKGPASLVTLNDELHFSTPMFHGAENRYLESWERFGVIIDQAGVVGNNTGVRIRNVAGSNIIAVIEKLYVQNINAADNIVSLAINPAVAVNLGALVPTQNRRFDARGRSNTSLILSQDSNYGAVLATTIAALQIPANRGAEFITLDIQELPLLPGDAWDVRSNNSNSEIQVTAWWRERFLEDSERS